LNKRDHRRGSLEWEAEQKWLEEKERLEAFNHYGEECIVVCRERPHSREAMARQQALLVAAQHSHGKVEKPYENWRRAMLAGYFYVETAFPRLSETLIACRAGQTVDVSPLIDYLEAHPYFFRSGFRAVYCIRYLKRSPLTVEQLERLHNVVLMIVDKRDRREFRHYCRLARRINAPTLTTALEERTTSPDKDLARRAGWMLNACRPDTRA
jgi:hypothetical protein